MEAALNQEELQQELPSEEDACSGILPQELAIEQEQEPFLDAQEDCLAMLDEAAQEATPSEPNLTQDLRLDDTTSSPPITTDGLRALFLSPEAAAPRDTSRNFEESTPGSLRPPTRPHPRPSRPRFPTKASPRTNRSFSTSTRLPASLQERRPQFLVTLF